MRLPLVVLAFFAFFGGVLDLPWVHTHNLESWLAPVFAGTLYDDNLSAAAEWALPLTDIVAARHRCHRGGLAVAWRGGRQAGAGAGVPAAGRYWDDFYDTIIGRPSQRLATFFAWVVDARCHRRRRQRQRAPGQGHRHRGAQAADGLRPQLRAGIAIGLALIIAFMLSRTWWG